MHRCAHKGFPSIYSYLHGRPNHYASHEFVPLAFDSPFRAFRATVIHRFSTTSDTSASNPDDTRVSHRSEDSCAKRTALASSSRGGASFLLLDYNWRPEVLKNFPLYYFISATDVTQKCKDGSWQWFEKTVGTTVQPFRLAQHGRAKRHWGMLSFPNYSKTIGSVIFAQCGSMVMGTLFLLWAGLR